MTRLGNLLFWACIFWLFGSIAGVMAQDKTMPEHLKKHDASLMNSPGPDKKNVAVLLYDGALLLDYGIAAEMFLAADFMRQFYVYTVCRDSDVTVSILGSVHADFTYKDAPPADIVVVPGGPTWQVEATDSATVQYLRTSNENGAVLFSVCTGSLLLAKAGLLKNRPATTNQQALSVLTSLSPSTRAVPDVKFVDDSDVVTSAGAGTAIESTLHMIKRFTDDKVAADLAKRYLDYPYSFE